jgi:hypothetical protein
MRNGAGDSRLNNSAMAIGRDIIAFINKAIDTEGLPNGRSTHEVYV